MMKRVAWSLVALILTGATLVWGYERWATITADSFQRDPDLTTYDLVSKPDGAGLAGSVWRARVLGTCGYVHELDLAFATDTSGVEVNRNAMWDWDTPLRLVFGGWAESTFREPFVTDGNRLIMLRDTLDHRLGNRLEYEVDGDQLVTQFHFASESQGRYNPRLHADETLHGLASSSRRR